jgi:hypothetical protein
LVASYGKQQPKTTSGKMTTKEDYDKMSSNDFDDYINEAKKEYDYLVEINTDELPFKDYLKAKIIYDSQESIRLKLEIIADYIGSIE